jgi:hypothetical protein
MTSSTFHVASVPAEKKAIGYRWQDDQWIDEPILPHGAFGAMGGLWTTIPDLSKWVAFLMSAYPPRDGADNGPLKRSSAREMQELARFNRSFTRRTSVDAPLQLSASGYGYGLGVSTDCRFKHVVSHGGGLPGYGSLMTWLPQHGVGLVFMSNRTYGSAGMLFFDTLDALKKTDAMPARTPTPAPVLLAMQREASSLLMQWNEATATKFVADNFFLDKTAERWKKETTDLAAKHGTCTMGAIDPENALRGRWRLTCERGWIDVFMTLAPTPHPTIQALTASSVLPPDATLSAALATVLHPASADAFVAEFDHAKLKRQLAALASGWGQCAQTEPLRGDGTTRVAMKLACEKGGAVADVELDADSKKIKSVEILPSADQPCVQ